MSTKGELADAIRLLAAGLGVTDIGDTPYLRQIHDRLEEIRELHRQSHEASEAIRAEAQAVLDAHAESARDYLEQVDAPEPTDLHPFVSAPDGTTVRDLADGGRLLSLIDGALVRVGAEGGLTFIGEDGAVVPLKPARGGIVGLPDGRELALKPEAIRVTHDAAGIEGLPFDIDPVEVADGRYRVELPGGTRLDMSHRERTAVLGNTDGTVDVVGLASIEGIGEEVEVRPVPGGAKAFAALASGHRGIVEADGTIHLTTVNGLDLLGKGLRFPFQFERRSGGAQVTAATTTEHEHIHESILQILGTTPGERFLRPEFGSRLKSLVFEANDEVLKGLIRHYIIEAIKRWDKRVIVTTVTFDPSPQEIDRHVLPARISYRVIQTQVEGNLVYPFHREPTQGLRSPTNHRRRR